MKEQEILDILAEAGVLLQGHFLLTSGKHSNKYLQCAKIFRNAKFSEPLCNCLAEKFKNLGTDTVIGPAMGAVQMAYEVGKQLGVDNYFTERVDGEMCLRRGFTVIPGQKFVVVEDVITTGGSVAEVIEVIKEAGGIVAAVGVIVNRSGRKDFDGIPLYSVIEVDVEAYEPESCPLCKEGKIELVKPGSRVVKN